MRVININGKAEKRKRLPFGYEDPSCPERTLGATDRYLTRNGALVSGDGRIPFFQISKGVLGRGN